MVTGGMGGGNILEKGGIEHPLVVLTAKPTPDENNQSKGQLKDLCEDIQIVREIEKSNGVRSCPMA